MLKFGGNVFMSLGYSNVTVPIIEIAHNICLFQEYMQSRLSALLLKSSFTMEEEHELSGGDNDVVNADEVDEEYKQMFDEMEVITEKENIKGQSVKRKGKMKTVDKLEDVSNQYEELIDETVEVLERPSSLGKRPKRKCNAKMSKQYEEEPNNEIVKVTETPNTSDKQHKTKSKTKGKISKQYEEEPMDEMVEVTETPNSSEKRPKNKPKTKVKRLKET